jgi:hypothetical protein
MKLPLSKKAVSFRAIYWEADIASSACLAGVEWVRCIGQPT